MDTYREPVQSQRIGALGRRRCNFVVIFALFCGLLPMHAWGQQSQDVQIEMLLTSWYAQGAPEEGQVEQDRAFLVHLKQNLGYSDDQIRTAMRAALEENPELLGEPLTQVLAQYLLLPQPDKSPSSADSASSSAPEHSDAQQPRSNVPKRRQYVPGAAQLRSFGWSFVIGVRLQHLSTALSVMGSGDGIPMMHTLLPVLGPLFTGLYLGGEQNTAIGVLGAVFEGVGGAFLFIGNIPLQDYSEPREGKRHHRQTFLVGIPGGVGIRVAF